MKFLTSLITATYMLLLSIKANGEPATEESLLQLEATLTQNTSSSIIMGLIVLVALGFIAGQQR